MNHMKYLLCLILVLLIVGCSQQQTQTMTDNQPDVTPTGGLAVKTDVEIVNFAFNPDTVTIKKGTTIIWTNMDSVQHTVTSVSGNEMDSDKLSKGQTYTHTFDTAGTYDYYCTIHPSMHGTVVVEESDLSQGTQYN